jgi:hypothetical protein
VRSSGTQGLQSRVLRGVCLLHLWQPRLAYHQQALCRKLMDYNNLWLLP